MTLQRPRSRIAWRVLRVAIPLLACAALLGVLAAGYATVPALGPALDPGQGVWTSASGGELPHSQALRLPGLAHPVQVSFTSHGVPSSGRPARRPVPGPRLPAGPVPAEPRWTWNGGSARAGWPSSPARPQ